MKQKFRGWDIVAEKLQEYAKKEGDWLNKSQRASLRAMAERIPQNGLVLADEVGMGKTRIAVALAQAVVKAGGRVAILVPPGLGFQWQDELRKGDIRDAPSILRSMWAYLEAWENADTPQPWFEKEVVMVSHAFANWRMGINSHNWRWALLPVLYAFWRKRTEGRFPRGYRHNELLDDLWVCNAANNICKNIPDNKSHPAFYRMWELSDQTPWPDALDAGEYGGQEALRSLLEQAVGLGLGVFDLVIIDEAHKSRGAESGLSRLLDNVMLSAKDTRRLAMTATPVELDISQWQQTLARIGVGDMSAIAEAIQNYGHAARRVRQCWHVSEEARRAYAQAACAFQNALSPYLLRRDKRQDEAVAKFAEVTGESYDAYRWESEITINPESLTPAWRQAICAAESLSLVASYSDDPEAKRLRLTFGNGHGIAALLDRIHCDEKEDLKQMKYDMAEKNGAEEETGQIEIEDQGARTKRQQRGQWWQNLIATVFNNEELGLFDHPSILAAVEEIERYTSQGEKVLIFGRFTKPMRVLTDLLNARQMLRCLIEKKPWPQSKVHSSEEHDEWPAVKAAHCQIECDFEIDEIDDRLEKQYRQWENKRERLRNHLVEWIGKGLSYYQHDVTSHSLFHAVQKDDTDARALLARALDELMENTGDPTPQQCADAFVALMAALRDRDEGDTDGNDELDKKEAKQIWPTLKMRLQEEYGVQRGTFARLMYGGTKPETRRMLQLAFNRRDSFPKVLVAQSMVGREGLNLHQACRVVVLLHPEWNPGVVEQQVGRVDRVGSLWAQALDKAIEAGAEIPRIEIRPVIFRGTYDEHHWQILRERWDDLRAQLHGIIIPQRFRSTDDLQKRELIQQLDKAGPDFTPPIGTLRSM